MSARRNVGMSIAAQVWLMVLLTILIVGGLIAVNTRTEFANQKERVRDALVQRGTATAEVLVPSLEPGGDTEQTLRPLADDPAVMALGRGCNTALATLQQAIDLGYLEVIDASGTVRCAGLKAHLTQRADFAQVPSLLRAVTNRTAGTDGAIKDPQTGALSFFTTLPLRTAEPLSLVYVFPTQESLVPDDTDTKIASLVVDTRDGTVLMRYPDVDGAVGRSIRGTALEQVASRLSATTTADGLDGVKRIYRTIGLGDTPYRLVVGQSQAQAYADAYKALWRDLAFGGALIVVVGGLGLLLQRRVAKPARRLRQALDHMDDSEGPLAPTQGPSELAQVAKAFNRVTTARRRADGLSRAILQHTSDYVLVLDGSGHVTFMGPTAREVLGLAENATYADLLALVHPADRDRTIQALAGWRDVPSDDLVLEIRAHDKAANLRHLEVRAQNLLSDPSVLGVVLTGRDVTERKRFEQHLAHQARHDPLTDLPNRAAVVERLAGLLGDDSPPVAVLFVDLDRFKLVNDSHGHPVGDKVLVTVAQRLVTAIRPGDLVGRFGGDEFVVVAASVGNDSAALELAGRLQRALEEPLTVEQRDLFVSASIGICLTRPGDTPDGVMRDVDTAVYRAKAAGRNCSALFDDAMRDDAQRLLRTESDLHGALQRQELAVVLQPVFALDDGALVGAEALLRWHHPERGLVGPVEFIPVAEETGLIVPIGEWVLREACSWAASEGLRVGRPVRVSVNVSPRQLDHPSFVDTVQEVLTTTGLAARLLCLEVTEGALVDDADTASMMLGALHDMGVRISIDDFGTGWSSLTYLQQFPVDDIKLDRSYVSRMTADSTAAAIVASLIGLAGAMGLTVTAEGVETQEQLNFLRAHGCDNGQGYLFSRPMPAAELAPIVTSGQSWLPVG